MRNYVGSLKGMQGKVVEGEFLYKWDYYGGEAIAEVLTSLFLKACNVNPKLYTYYELDNLNTCKCRLFTDRATKVYSFADILDRFVIPNCTWANRIRKLAKRSSKSEGYSLLLSYWLKNNWNKWSAEERVSFVVDTLSEFCVEGRDYIEFYLRFMVSLDTLRLNTDRHLNNISIVSDMEKGVFYLAPIYDNGLSMGVTDKLYVRQDIVKNAVLSKTSFKPFSADYKKALRAVGGFLVLPFDVKKFCVLLRESGVPIVGI